jgi:hypothetical protein
LVLEGFEQVVTGLSDATAYDHEVRVKGVYEVRNSTAEKLCGLSYYLQAELVSVPRCLRYQLRGDFGGIAIHVIEQS